MHRLFLGFIGFLGFISFFLAPPSVSAATPLTYRYKHFVFQIDPAAYPQWKTSVEQWTYNGRLFDPPAAFRVDGDVLSPLPPGVRRSAVIAWNRNAVRGTLEKLIGTPLRRARGTVIIRRTGSGAIVFDGVGLPGREVDMEAATEMTVRALEQDMREIDVPVAEIDPELTVADAVLRDMGIREVVTVGESDFTGSPVNRRFNIDVGLKRFNGHLIPQGTVFSFNAVLGRVDASTGYRKELVIKGDRTEPDYGGGLCQISSTAYRGVWEYGFPILKRKNHSYVVRYYAPAGTDATVYPGAVDMTFLNDSPGALLLQTHQEHNRAYYIYYGTRDGRRADFVGPFITGRKDPPPDRTELTLDLPPGERKKLNERVPGLTAVWYRFVERGTGAVLREKVTSIYEARPLFTAIGVTQLPPGYGKQSESGETAAETNTSSSMSSSVIQSSSSPRFRRPPTRRR